MTNHQIQLIKESWVSVTTLDPLKMGDLFHRKLFTLSPEMEPLFRENLAQQSHNFLLMLNYLIKKLNRITDILDDVKKLARRYMKYGVKKNHFYSVASALLWSLEQSLGKLWTKDICEAWTTCLTRLSSVIVNASVYSERNVLY